MTRWFRHYAGMQRDDKLVRAAVRSKQTVERVVWVWGALLESAAEINDAGRFDFDVDEAAYFLRCDPGDLTSIVGALCDLGRVNDGKVTKWGDRQFDSDASRERQQRYRDRKKSSHGDGGDVTRPSPDGGVTLQETETDTKPEDKTARPVVDAVGARVSFDDVWEAFPQNPSSSESEARAAFERIPVNEHADVIAAAERRARWFGQDCEARDRTVDEGLRFEPHLSTWLRGKWRDSLKLPLKETKPATAVIPTVKLDRILHAGLFEACERIGRAGKRAPMDQWAFPTSIVEQAKSELEQARAAA